MVSLKAILPLIFIIAILIFEERVSIPSCKTISRNGVNEEGGVGFDSEGDLRVMLVADMLLMGSEASYMSLYFRDAYLTKFFKKSFERLKPDMLVVLGDVSAKGSKLTNSKWLSVLQQFQKILGPWIALPFHIGLGDRDIGECNKLNEKYVNWICSKLPGLDSTGCSSFEVSNISFVSINAVAMLCENNDLHFSVEKFIERESFDLRSYSKDAKKRKNEPEDLGEINTNFGWRENTVSSGSGPVLLLHFPLHQTTSNNCEGSTVLKRALNSSPRENSDNRRVSGAGPYKLLHTVPPNVSEYIFQALKPRIIFSAHTHEFCDHTHMDGTREVTVPAMTWDARDDPGFVFATFGRSRTVTVSQCSLVRESHVIMFYISFFVILTFTMLIANRSELISSRR
ncbi:hypothetical protein GIB67_026028 [Kingdonia uniflora]|uniref:Calcineurin-like phosphoesterase domain-containing protein n=1 Tax=Kingdonia uniflora TaxID=39325 RepID=A0A7J7M2V5_9MAGN|nr:hypothetical protein GIB67_026028 [Kingdonia uniflora]